MDIVTLGAALNGSAEYVNSHFKGGSNIQIVDNPDGTQTINASGEVSSEDTVARAEIAEMKDGTNIDSFGDVETALATKANTATTYTKTEVDTALGLKQDTISDLSTIRSGAALGATAVQPETGKGLSANDYTTAEKTKLDSLAEIKTIGTGLELDSNGELTATGGGGGGFTPTTAQLAAMNSGITAEKLQADETALAGKVDKETGKGLSANDFTTVEKTKLAGIAEGAEVNVQSNWTQTTTTADDYIKNKPTLGTAATKNATDTYNATGTDVTTGKAVAAALATLPEPMVFQGSLGTGGTITTLPTASSSNKGYVYKVITAGTYASQSAKVGDTFISDGSAWVLIPSGDEPSGTVTNVAVANSGGLTINGSPITSSGTITVGHSNSVTAKTSSSLKKFTYDAYGHVTGSSELSTAESDALASGIDSTKVAQIETNKNNISLLCDANGKKQLIPNFGTLTNGSVTYTHNSDSTITITGSKEAGTENYVDIAQKSYEDYGLKSGDTIQVVNRVSTPVILAIIFTSSTSTSSPNYTMNGTNTYTLPENYTGFRIRFLLTSSSTNINVTINPLVCNKALYDISSATTPYSMSNAELTAAEKQNENNISLVEQNIRKNIASINNGTNAVFLQIPVTAAANKSYQISIGTLSSDETSAEQGCRIALMNGENVVSNIIYMARGNNKTGVLTTTGAADSLWIYASGAYQSSVGKSVTVANLMLCDKALYDAGYTDYQPYIPTVEDIMAMINQ